MRIAYIYSPKLRPLHAKLAQRRPSPYYSQSYSVIFVQELSLTKLKGRQGYNDFKFLFTLKACNVRQCLGIDVGLHRLR